MIQRIKKGFTIIELMLAMTLVSMLIIAIAIMVMQMSSIMNKGKTMKDLNAASRAINTDFTTKFNSLQTIQEWGDNRPKNAPEANAVYVKSATSGSGAFCTGDFSYLWNSAQSINRLNEPSAPEVEIRYRGSASNDSSIRLIRVRDVAKEYCSNRLSWTNIPRDSGQVTDILSSSEAGLMIYDIRFRKINEDAVSGQSLINIQYVLGTKNDDGQVNALSCNPSSSSSDYCAINKFDLIVRTIGRR